MTHFKLNLTHTEMERFALIDTQNVLEDLNYTLNTARYNKHTVNNYKQPTTETTLSLTTYNDA